MYKTQKLPPTKPTPKGKMPHEQNKKKGKSFDKANPWGQSSKSPPKSMTVNKVKSDDDNGKNDNNYNDNSKNDNNGKY